MGRMERSERLKACARQQPLAAHQLQQINSRLHYYQCNLIPLIACCAIIPVVGALFINGVGNFVICENVGIDTVPI